MVLPFGWPIAHNGVEKGAPESTLRWQDRARQFTGSDAGYRREREKAIRAWECTRAFFTDPLGVLVRRARAFAFDDCRFRLPLASVKALEIVCLLSLVASGGHRGLTRNWWLHR